MINPAKLSTRNEAVRELFEAVAELGDSFYEEALQLCDDEREAAFLASATLLSTLEREKVLATPVRRVHSA